MIVTRLSQACMCAASVVALTSCGLFSSKPAPTSAAHGSQEFDPYANTWKPADRAVVPPPSEPNALLAENKAEAARQNSTLNKAGRAVGNTATAVGQAVKKPLEWLPFGKKAEAPVEEVKPAVPVTATSAAKPQ